ncbi:MAG: hypothetical protein QOK15_3680, partial [Nocardioidaceae bacterium]|nr:hypothetical protein [Nocardioidaceae bacterium]
SAVERWGTNDRFTTLADASAALTEAPGDLDLVLVLSVLHHVPDYLSLLDRVVRRLRTGGTLLTLQDPLYYPRLDRLTRRADRLAYLTWRAGEGQVRAGTRAALRRARGDYPSAPDGGLTYYHVTRQGVDERAVLEALGPRFARVQLITYWSNHLGPAARVAERVGLRNTFAVRASGFGS